MDTPQHDSEDPIAAAVTAIEAGKIIVYPTETVYGLGANATDHEAVEQLFALKQRERSKPLSVAIPDVDTLDLVARPSDRTRRFVETFLPGPFTVVCRRHEALPENLTAGRERIGIRIPACERTLNLLAQTPPLTATSANLAGGPNVSHPDELDPALRKNVAVVVDGGRTTGKPSTVVDIDRGVIHRRGQHADAVEKWLDDYPVSP